MLRCDVSLYRSLLRRLSFGELVALYERTAPHYEKLAGVIAEELSQRLCSISDPIA
jgi:hypothetical protein